MNLSNTIELPTLPALHFHPGLSDAGRETLVLLHGWGCDSRVWQPLLPWLRQHHDVICVDLPGFGASVDCACATADEFLQQLEGLLPSRFSLIGWSLGALLATRLAERMQHSGRLEHLICLGAGPRFVGAEGPAMRPAVFDAFAALVSAEPRMAMQRFAQLQARNDGNQRQLVRALRGLDEGARVNQHQALVLLDWLRALDNRPLLAKLTLPVLHVLGGRDQLVPVAAAQAIGQLNPCHRVSVFDDCAHALHLTAPERLATLLDDFLRPRSLPSVQAVARSFSRAAHSYADNARLQSRAGEILLARVPRLGLGARVLDLGSGAGTLLPALREKTVADCMALDLSPAMLASISPALRAQVPAICGRADQLPLADGSVDFVFSALMLQWCSNPQEVFKEIARILKPGGRCLFTSLGPQTLWQLKHAWRQVDGDVHVNSFLPGEALATAGRAAGFTAVNVDSQGLRLLCQDFDELLASLRLTGARNLHRRGVGLGGRARLGALKQAYEQWRNDDGLLPEDYELLVGELQRA